MSRNSGSNQSFGSSKTQKIPTISDILGRLRAANGGDGYKGAEMELLLREEHLRNEAVELREKGDILEADVVGLKAELENLRDERSVLQRELEVKDDQLNEAARLLSMSKESEAKTIKRCDKVERFWRDEVELRRKCKDEKEVLNEKVRELKEELRGKGGELIQVRRRVEGFEGEKAEFETVLRGKNKELEALRKEMRVKDRENVELSAKVRELEGVMERNEELIKEMSKFEGLVREKDGKIQELEGTLNGFVGKLDDLEKSVAVIDEQKNGLVREKKEIMAKFDKLASDVISCLCIDVVKDKKFSSSHIGKIIAGVMAAQDNGGVKTTGNVLEADSASRSRDNETARSKLFGEKEPSVATACNKDNTSPIYIQIDSDDEMPPHNTDLKRERESPMCATQRHPDEESSVEILNPKWKIRKLEQLDEPVKHQQSVVASGSGGDRNFRTLQKQAASIRKCGEYLSRKVSEPGSNCPPQHDVSKGLKAELSFSPKLKEFMAKCRQSQEKNAIERVTDMALACDKNDEFCAKAICALYRQHKSRSGCRRLQGRDSNRVTSLAEFLIGGDPNSDKKRSMSDLKKRDPEGLEDCRKLAREYSEQLFEIFMSKDGDPLFSHLSTKVEER